VGLSIKFWWNLPHWEWK